MAKQKTVVPFRGTQEQEKELIKIIENLINIPRLWEEYRFHKIPIKQQKNSSL